MMRFIEDQFSQMHTVMWFSHKEKEELYSWQSKENFLNELKPTCKLFMNFMLQKS